MHIRAIDPTGAKGPLQFAWTREQLEDHRRQALLNGLNQQGYNLSVCLDAISGTKPQIIDKLTTGDDIVRQNVIVVLYDESLPDSKLKGPPPFGSEDTTNSQFVTSRMLPSFCVTAPNAVYGIYALVEAPLSAEERPSAPSSSKRAQIAPKAHYGSDGFVPMPGSRVYG